MSGKWHFTLPFPRNQHQCIHQAFQAGESDEVFATGACLCLQIFASWSAEGGEDISDRVATAMHSFQRSLMTALRDYPANTNKLLVDSALSSLGTYHRVHWLDELLDYSNKVDIILRAMNQSSTKVAYKEGSLVLCRLVAAELEDSTREITRCDGILVLISVMELVTDSKALEILATYYFSAPNEEARETTIVKPLIQNDALPCMVASTMVRMCRAQAAEMHILRPYFIALVTRRCKGLDGGLILHNLASCSMEQDPRYESFNWPLERSRLDLIVVARAFGRNGADLVRDKNNRLPLHVAIQSNRSETTVWALVGGNEAFCSQAFGGWLPFQLAAREDCDVGVINLMLREDSSCLKLETCWNPS
jgi:hypothetical protein